MATTDITTLIRRFAPRVYLYPNRAGLWHYEEDCYPGAVDWYIGRTRLCAPWDRSSATAVVDPHPTPTRLALHGAGQGNLYLDDQGDATTRRGTMPGDAAWPPPCYAHAVPVLQADGTPTSLMQFQYWLFYPFNGRLGSTSAGEHVGDWEYVIVEVDNRATITRVYLSCHAYDAAHWHTHGVSYAPDPADPEARHPVVYAAYHSHANYRDAGLQTRLPGGDDRTAQGPAWDTWAHLLRIEAAAPGAADNQDWVLYTGRFGQTPHNQFGDSPTGPATRGAFAGLPDGTLLREDGSADTYQLHGGAQFLIPPGWLRQPSYRPLPIVPVPGGFLRAFPAAPVDGTLLRALTDEPGTCSVVYGGARFAVVPGDAASLAGAGDAPANVVVVPDLGQIPTIPRDGTLLCGRRNPQLIYVMQDQRKRQLTDHADPQALAQYGGGALVRQVPDAALDAIPSA
jgi:hypothetical protein